MNIYRLGDPNCWINFLHDSYERWFNEILIPELFTNREAPDWVDDLLNDALGG